MPFPTENITTLPDLEAYINNNIVPNASELISGEKHNNVLWGLRNLIVQANTNFAKVKVSSTGGDITLPAVMTSFINNTPNTIRWDDNFQNEYYINNMTGNIIALAENFAYYNALGEPIVYIPANSNVHIAKAENGLWVEIGGGSAASGGTGGTVAVSTFFSAEDPYIDNITVPAMSNITVFNTIHNGNVSFMLPQEAEDMYWGFVEPITEPIKTAWVHTASGQVGDYAVRAAFEIGTSRYYLSRNPWALTYQTAIQLLK